MPDGNFGLSRDPNLLTILTMVNNPDDLPAIRDAMKRTVDRIRTEPCDQKFLQDTQSAMKYGFLMSLETAQGVAFALRSFEEGYVASATDFTESDIRGIRGRWWISLVPVNEDPAGARVGQSPAVHGNCSIDHYEIEPLAELMRLFESGLVLDLLRIEENHVGRHPFADHPAVREAETKGGQGGHAPDSIFQCEHLSAAYEFGDHSGIGAV